MADFGEENKVNSVFGGVKFDNQQNENIGVQQNDFQVIGNAQSLKNGSFQEITNAGTIRNKNLPVKKGFWNSFKGFWLQEINWNKEIKVELTPYQQKVENEINDFLHQEVTWDKVYNFLFKDIGSKNKNIAE